MGLTTSGGRDADALLLALGADSSELGSLTKLSIPHDVQANSTVASVPSARHRP